MINKGINPETGMVVKKNGNMVGKPGQSGIRGALKDNRGHLLHFKSQLICGRFK